MSLFLLLLLWKQFTVSREVIFHCRTRKVPEKLGEKENVLTDVNKNDLYFKRWSLMLHPKKNVFCGFLQRTLALSVVNYSTFLRFRTFFTFDLRKLGKKFIIAKNFYSHHNRRIIKSYLSALKLCRARWW